MGLDSKEAEDITPTALTRMALNVAHGLKYLTDLKYVHRYVSPVAKWVPRIWPKLVV